jgi:membrane-associated phospholipid phosphatase
VSVGAKFIIAWVVAFALFVFACILAGTYDTFPADIWLAHRVQEIDLRALERALDWAEDSADLPVVALMCVITAGLLLFVRDGRGALIMLIAVTGRVLTTWIAKDLIQRPRPSADLVDFTSQPSSFSFPSGHAAAAFVLYGLIFYFATVHIQNSLARGAVQVICVSVIIGAGVERIYVGHHWPSDVLGGYWHGALIVSAAIAIHQLAPRLSLQVTSGHPLRLHVRRHSPEKGLGRPHES